MFSSSRWLMFASVLLLCSAHAAHAGGPRFVTGTTYPQAGQPMAFYTSQLQYFTDPGDLSSTVNHAQADAMVAAAASVWNVQTTSLFLSQGGELAEHVSADNSYFDGTSVVFPADAASSNYLAVPIAVIYDTDGSVTDLLLGNGASDPMGCNQNGVTESVDAFGASGTIEHAVILLNGRCINSESARPQQLLQMQYQLTRIFGRVLGLAWSQLNDNIFTYSPQPTTAQMQNWPLMHPIDVVCGPYTYQCMVQPFTLRQDDISALIQLYQVNNAALAQGRQYIYNTADIIGGNIYFPDGQGMEQVNITVSRWTTADSTWEPWEIVSGISGYSYQANTGNPVSGPESAIENVGNWSATAEGSFYLAGVQVTGVFANLRFTAEPINPLYSGRYAIGAYQGPPRSPSGSVQSFYGWTLGPWNYYRFNDTIPDAAGSCNPGNGGTESSPAAADASGWWSGQICGSGHTSWWSATIKANRTWTIETTALDDSGNATVQKLQPVLGIWNTSDPTGTLPTVACEPTPLNSMSLGMTQLQMPSATSDSSLRIAVADAYGAGRPDFKYNARILYADSVAPATVGSGGGQITITGIGFRLGNVVLVNAVPAKVLSWTSTQIIAVAPSMSAAGASTAAVDVEVLDSRTGGNSTMQASLTYTPSTIDGIVLVGAPSSLETGIPASTPLTVRVVGTDGSTPQPGASVRFAVVHGSVTMGCGAAPCTLTTDASGLAQTTLTGAAAGSVTISATELSGGASVQVTMTDADPVRQVALTANPAYLAAGASASWPLSLTATQDGAPASGVPIVWTLSPALSVQNPPSSTSANGTLSLTVQASSVGAATANVLTGCAWTNICASWTVYGVDPSQWTVSVATGAGQSPVVPATLGPVGLQLTDAAGHVLQGAVVNVYQTSDAWEGTCPVLGPCSAAPLLASSQSTAFSDAKGQVQLTPLEVPNVPQVVHIAASTGTQGFLTLSLPVAP